MTTRIKHNFVSGKADGPDVTEVKPSDWNHDHDWTSDQAGFVLGRDTSGAGAIQELPLAISPTGDMKVLGTGGFQTPSGTTAQRLAPPVPGTIRYNTDLQVLEVYGGDGTASWTPIVVGANVPVGATMGWYLITAPVGWVFVDGKTVGDDTSGADHNTQAFKNLFLYFYNLPDAICPVSGGRTTDGLTDWNLHKKIQMPNESGAVSAHMEAAPNFLPSGGNQPGTLLGSASQVAGLSVAGWTGNTNTGPQFGIVGGGPAVPDHGHYFSWVGNTNLFSVVQKTIVKNVIIKY